MAYRVVIGYCLCVLAEKYLKTVILYYYSVVFLYMDYLLVITTLIVRFSVVV